MTKSKESFETAFKKLEQIVEKMGSGSLPLEESLQLFEEANKLAGFCSTTLSQAEQKVELLLKQKNGDLILDESGSAETEPFDMASKSHFR